MKGLHQKVILMQPFLLYARLNEMSDTKDELIEFTDCSKQH